MQYFRDNSMQYFLHKYDRIYNILNQATIFVYQRCLETTTIFPVIKFKMASPTAPIATPHVIENPLLVYATYCKGRRGKNGGLRPFALGNIHASLYPCSFSAFFFITIRFYGMFRGHVYESVILREV